MNALIRYVCIAPSHTRPKEDARGDLTVHESDWAFCPAEAAGAHRWRDVGGITVRELRRFGLRTPREVAIAPEA